MTIKILHFVQDDTHPKMFAKIIPALRTPRGVDAFDYAVPDGVTVRRGDLVRIPFRKQVIVGVVADVMETSDVADKAKPLIDRYADVHVPDACVDLVAWAADATFSSQASVLHAWLRQLPKRLPLIVKHPDTKPPELRLGTLHDRWVRTPTRALADELETRYAIRASHSAVRDLRSPLRNTRILVVTPWKERAASLAQELHAGLLTGDTPTLDAFVAWCRFVTESGSILVTTRVGAWLAAAADVVMLDEPENDDHKQDELAPRYDSRAIAEWCSRHAGTVVERFGLTPPLSSDGKAPTIPLPVVVRERQRAGHSDVPLLLADTVVDLIEHEGPRVVIHPVLGTQARLSCRDCGWTATCPRCTFPLSLLDKGAECRRCHAKADAPLECPQCGGTSLGSSWPGIDRLKKAWEAKHADCDLEWRGHAVADIEKPFLKGSLVVVTDGSLLAGATEDVRRLERTAIAYRRLADRIADAEGKLIVQSDASLLPKWEAWLTEEGFDAFRQEELASRKLFGYPPATRIVKALVDGDEAQAEAWGVAARERLGSAWEVKGPWPIAYRANSRGSRFVWHLLPPDGCSQEEKVKTLSPLADQAILDLDPTAFFR